MGGVGGEVAGLSLAVAEVEATGTGTLLNRVADSDERPLMRRDEVLEDWRRRWLAVRAWFAADAGEKSRAAELAAATRAGVSSVIALLRQITEPQRGGGNPPPPPRPPAPLPPRVA